jgi:hypothetical protein
VCVAANGCSGNGECGSNDACTCYDNYIGADCSQRTCGSGYAWVDTPLGDLNHDGEVTKFYPAATSAEMTFATIANRRTYLIDGAYGYVLSQFSNKMVPEYFPVYDGDSNNGYIAGQNGPVGGLKAKIQEAHFYAECSGRGECDRSSGECQCYDGFIGSVCQRTVCPNDCSGNGVCMTVKEVANGRGGTNGLNYRAVAKYASHTVYEGVSARFEYNHWDSEKSQTCVCDFGYTGPDCSLRLCPKGRDPLLRGKTLCNNADCQSEVQSIVIKLATAAGSTPLVMRLGYIDIHGSDPTRPLYSAPFTLDTGFTAFIYEELLQNALSTFPNNVLFGVNVTISGAADGGTPVTGIYKQQTVLSGDNDELEFKFDFRHGPQGNVNPIFIDKVSGGTGFEYATYDSAGKVTTVNNAAGTNVAETAGLASQAVNTVTEAAGNTPYIECSGRGMCDYSSGLCECFAGYFGPVCSYQNALAM